MFFVNYLDLMSALVRACISNSSAVVRILLRSCQKKNKKD